MLIAIRHSAIVECKSDWKSMHSYFRIDSMSSLGAGKKTSKLCQIVETSTDIFRNRWTSANLLFSFWGFYDRRSAIKWDYGVVLSRKRQKLKSDTWSLASQACFEKICERFVSITGLALSDYKQQHENPNVSRSKPNEQINYNDECPINGLTL